MPGTPERPRRGRPRDWHDKSAQNTIKSLDRALEVLEHLSQTPGQALGAIAEETGQSPATVYRTLVTLEGRGLVEFDPDSQIWQIGAQAFVIGAQFLRRTSLIERARPIMRRLMEATGETANLGVEKEGAVLFVSQVETPAVIRAFFAPGTLSPLHASGIGKALLAQMEPARRARALGTAAPGGALERFTPRTLTDPGALAQDLARTRARGYAIDDEEKTEGMRCVAAPVFDMSGEAVAGISVSGPTSRVGREDFARLATPVIEAARALSAAIGGRAPDGGSAPGGQDGAQGFTIG